MKRKVADIKGFSLWLIGAIAVLCSCRDDSRLVPSSETEGTRRNLVINLTVQQPGIPSPASRSPFTPDDTEEKGEYALGFTQAESRINTLTLIMMEADGENELFETWQTVKVDNPNAGVYDISFTLSGITGTKRFYVIANAEQKHINAFWAKDRIFDAGEGASGHNIVGSLMTVDHDTNGEGAGSDIVMAGIVTTNNGDRDIVIPAGSGDTETDEKIELTIDDHPIDLVRTVAKVLLTCEPKSDTETEYVNVIDAKDKDTHPDGNGANTGWIRFEDVNYMLNVLNRKTYLDYRTDSQDDNYLKDPNYAISGLIGKRKSENEVTYGIKDLEAYQQEFLYYNTQEMVEMLNTNVPEYKKPEPCMVKTAIPYDENRIGAANKENANHYTEGLYCPENTVNNDMGIEDDADFQSVIRYVTTRVMVGAKYTPKIIWNGGEKAETATTEAQAQEILKKVTDEDNPLEPVTYLAGTFWRDDEGNYYSLAGMKKKLKEDPDTEFSRYDGGWGYYYTYIDEDAKNGVISMDKKRWGIKRNHYYIIKVEKIIAPGSAFPGNETMRIHSELIDWVDKGGSETEVKVPQKGEEAPQP